MEGRAVDRPSFFLDALTLEYVDTPPEPPVNYVVVTELLPQDATIAEKDEVARRAHADKRTVLQSAHDAARLVAPGLPGSKVDLWAFDRHPPGIVEWLHERGVQVIELFEFEGGEPPPEPPLPPPGFVPHNFVEKGTKMGFHCIGGEPTDLTDELAANGVILSSVKFVVAIGGLATARETWTLGRMIDVDGHMVEGYDPNGDPVWQAEARMAALLPAFAPYLNDLKIVEIVNEQNSPEWTVQHMENYGLFFRQAMRILERPEWGGVRLAMVSASLGTPEPWQWDAFALSGVFEHAAEYNHALSLHEYNTALNGPNSIICRYRDVYDRIILPRGLDIPLFITEYNVNHELLDTDLMAEWRAYDELVIQDPYVAGVNIFTLGMGWSNYVAATSAHLEQFKQYAISVKDRVNG